MDEPIIKSFSSPVRLKIICCLSNGKKNVNELVDTCGMSQSAVSQHLFKLRESGVVRDEKSGKNVFYSLVNPKAGKIAKEIIEFIDENK